MKKLASLILVIFLSFSLFAGDKTFALVLSGGGAKGIADIEILKELDRRGLYPDYVIGTSIGALVGAFYAAGYSGEELEDLIMSTNLMDLFLHIYSRSGAHELSGGDEIPLSNIYTLDFASDRVGAANGIIDDQHVASFLRTNLIRVLGIRDFDELSIPYRAVGTDLESGDEIIYSFGSLYSAMRGSMAIPIVFAPARTIEGKYVIDGGMVNNMPTDLARALGADVVLAVDLNDVYKEHNEGKIYYDIDTLSGVATQTLDLVTTPNTEKNYIYADYVIVPEISSFGVLDFGRAEEIREVGRKAVEDNQDVFDALSLELGVRERPLSYFDRAPFTIRSIVYPHFERYSNIFSYFQGKSADEALTAEFERALEYIKTEEGLKSIGYDIYDGVIVIRSESFPTLPSSVSLGANIEMGVKSSLSSKQGTLFYFIPHLSAFFDIMLPSSYGKLIAGLDVTSYTALFANYQYDFGASWSFFASLRLGVGDLSMLSVSDRIDRMNTSDFLFSAESGFAYEYLSRLRLEFSLDFDITSLGSVKSIDGHSDMPRRAFFDPKVNFNLKYRTLDTSDLHDAGLDIDFDSAIYLRAPLMYDIKLSFESILPSFVESTRLFINGEADTLRGNEYLGRSYVTNRSGRLTRDYLMLEVGGRVLFTDSVFMDVGIFAEGYEVNESSSRLWERSGNLIPFALIDSLDGGFSLRIGKRTDMGDLMAFVDITHRGTFSLGLEFV